jgi:hypothetical protein
MIRILKMTACGGLQDRGAVAAWLAKTAHPMEIIDHDIAKDIAANQ